MRTRILLVLLAAGLVTAGCSGDGDDVATATSTSSAVVTTVAVVTTATTVAPAVTTTPTTPTTTGPAALVLGPDGLGLVELGQSKDATISAISAVLGTLDETGTGCELGGPGTTTARWKELRVELAPGGEFRSYNVRPPNGVEAVLGLKTEEGIGLGSTVAELQATYGSRLKIPALPPELGGKDFSISYPGGDRTLRGSLSDTTAAGTITGFFTQVCE